MHTKRNRRSFGLIGVAAFFLYSQEARSSDLGDLFRVAIQGQDDVSLVFDVDVQGHHEPKSRDLRRIAYYFGPISESFTDTLLHIRGVAHGRAQGCGDGREDVDGDGVVTESDAVLLRDLVWSELAAQLETLTPAEAGLAPQVQNTGAGGLAQEIFQRARDQGLLPDPDHTDTDHDGIVDACDNCPLAYNPDQTNLDHDALGDDCDPGRTLDFVAPRISFSDVEDGATYYGSVIPIVEVVEGNLISSVVLLDGAPYSSGTAITSIGPHTIAVEAGDLAGNVASASVSFVVRAGFAPVNFAICSTGSAQLYNNAIVASIAANGTVTSSGHVASNGDLIISNNGSLAGSAVIGGNFVLGNNAIVSGDVFVFGSVAAGSQSIIAGQVQRLTEKPAPCSCDYDVAGIVAQLALFNDNASLLADPAIAPFFANNSLSVPDGAGVTLPQGDYYIDRVSVANNAVIQVAEGALVRLFVTGSIDVASNASINAPPATGARLFVVSAADAGTKLTLANNSNSVWSLYAPLADIDLLNNADLYGSVVGATVVVRNNGRLLVAENAVAPVPALECR